MKSIAGTLAAPFPWFGGKANAAELVWQAFGVVDNYVEPFAGSAAMLLAAPEGKRAADREAALLARKAPGGFNVPIPKSVLLGTSAKARARAAI